MNYLYDGPNLLEEVDQNGSVLARYTQGLYIHEPLAELRSGTTSYYHADGLGSVSSLSNSVAALANTYTYDSFGKPTSSTGTIINGFRYTGREFDGETGLFYYRARYYDQNTGRFISEDPVRFGTGTVNFYDYVENSPANYQDPTGNAPSCCQQNIDIARRELEIALTNSQIMKGGVLKKYKTCLLKFPDIKIKCDPNIPGCGKQRDFAASTIFISPSAAQGRKGPCGPLASTFLHEMVHICYNNDVTGKPLSDLGQEREAFQAECDGFGYGCACARDPRKCGYQF